MHTRWIVAPTFALMLAAGAAAQDVQPAPAPPPEPEPKLVEAPALNPTYSDDEIAKAAEMLTGIWVTTKPVTQFNGQGESNVVMSISPATVGGMADMLFVETAREDGIATPYRQSFYQLYRFKGQLRLRTLELRAPAAAQALMGVSLIPDQFPKTIAGADLFPTIDIELTSSDGGWTGASPAAYPDHRGGAVQMTSEIAFDGDSITISDIGYGPDGDVAWQIGGDEGVEFARTESSVDIRRYDDGLIVLHFVEPEGEEIQVGDWMVIHYLGRLTDGTKIDSSFDRGEPFRYKFPGDNLVKGWIRGTEGMTKGSRRRVIVPPALGWGERAVGPIPPNSTVIFDLECMYIEEDVPVEPRPAQLRQQEQQEQPAEGDPVEGG